MIDHPLVVRELNRLTLEVIKRERYIVRLEAVAIVTTGIAILFALAMSFH